MANNQSSLPVNQLQPNPFQPREKIRKEELQELTKSIQTYGILEPLVVAQTPAGFQIIAGERRWRAAKEAGLSEVPVLIKKTTPRGMLEMALVENVQRSDLNPLERAQAFKQLLRDFNFSVNNLADRIGKSAAYISNTVKLLDLPDAIKDGLVGKVISEGHARALGSLKDEASMVDCFKTILKEGASVRRAEELVRLYKEKIEKVLRPNQPKSVIHTIPAEQIKIWQSQMQPRFKVNSQLRLNRTNGSTRITIKLKGSPEKTQEDFDKIVSMLTGSVTTSS